MAWHGKAVGSAPEALFPLPYAYDLPSFTFLGLLPFPCAPSLGVPHQETFWQVLNLEDAARPIGRLSSRFETIRPSHGGVRVRLGVVGEDVSGLGIRKGRDAAESKTLAKGNKKLSYALNMPSPRNPPWPPQ